MNIRVYILISLIIHVSYAILTSLKNDDIDNDDDERDDIENDTDSNVDENTDITHVDNDEEKSKNNEKDKNDGDLGKIRISIDNDISIDTGSNAYTGLKTPLIIISPTTVIDYARLNKKMENSKKESNIVIQEKLAMSDAELKDAEARLAFYKADKSQLELLNNNQSNNKEEF